MTNSFSHRISKALEERRSKELTRSLVAAESGNSSELIRNGQRLVNFSSNDYLGLANDKALLKAWQKGLDLYGCGSGASPLVTGFSPAHQNFESELCEWLGFERAILFSSGFSANQALLFTLLEKGDLLYQDKLNHASLIEAGMLSPAIMRRFKHNDVDQLSQMLASNSKDQLNQLVVTEGVFSMDGDTAPLSALSDAVRNRAWLAVDDAHGIGVLGGEGRGSCNAQGVQPNILVVTFGKAFGLSGAAILCDRDTGDYLTQFARHHVYSTAIPPSQAYALSHALSMIKSQQWRRDKLAELKEAFNSSLKKHTEVIETQTPICPIIIGSSEKASVAAQRLNHLGLGVTAIRPPTVPMNMARLRITLTAAHSFEQLKRLSSSLEDVLGEINGC
ncbi:8-amino-7-oxononanoate synthase [Vibrio sp. ZSDE26]|uniref:8-amino-7-oxononanoate synthase n=1 Tax=Vibrio amylolyticus TaxID=2847292 RepID=A0A9X1XH36_9VIBR|nr:8-amino-7-oxononanoate synthase [Vibrio amylolyticus]MCK6262844.1 8-amino-7-oxononanoate synthase [Vibrio amylolyticus]